MQKQIKLASPILFLAALLGTRGATLAQTPEEIIVVGIVPGGATLDRSKVPYPVQHSQLEDLDAMRSASVANILQQSFSSVALNDAQNNPLQPDLQYRGFTASPLLGLAQGMAVYQNGVRINEPLGDAVNWDLLPLSAIESVTLSGGSNPLFGLNSLGGSLALDMKDGFGFEGVALNYSGGSFGRQSGSLEFGGNQGSFGYYLNAEFFDEDGWRDFSSSQALNLYGSIGWQFADSEVNLNYQHGDSELTGNGTSPVELLALNRAAIFSGPDSTENQLNMASLDFTHRLNSTLTLSGTVFTRHSKTNSFNGDGSEFAVCEFTNGDSLIEGIEDDDLEELGLEDDDICDGQFADDDALEDFLNNMAAMAGEDEEYSIENFSDDLSGTGLLSDAAINNISTRKQKSFGGDLQWALQGELFGAPAQLVWGAAYYSGDSQFDAVLELSDISPLTRLTTGLGTGTFVDSHATSIETENESASLYFTATADVSDSVALTLSARANRTAVVLQDRSGMRPELNGNHRFQRVNPAAGLTWQYHEDHNLYTNVSQSSRAPTPIELACNEGVFELAVQYAIERGEDPDDVDFECRLPNAFLADPPLEDVVTTSVELGSRGVLGELVYSVGVFHTSNRDDILFQTTGRQTGLFANVDKTQRQGLESSLAGQWGNLEWRSSYSYIDATFEDDFAVLSPNHQFADDEGQIRVNRGDAIPGIPAHQFKLNTRYRFNEKFSFGLDLIANSEQNLRGDESAQLPAVDGYYLINLSASYEINRSMSLFASVNNALDAEYETFGLLGEEPGELAVPIIEELTVPRFLGPAAPRAAFLGFRLRF